MKIKGTTVAMIVAGCVLVGSLTGKISDGYFSRSNNDTTPTTTEQPAENIEDTTAYVISEETTNNNSGENTQPIEQPVVQDETETYSDTFYGKDEFTSILSNRTNAPSISLEDAGSYCIRNRVGWSNVNNTETYNYNEFIVDGKVIFRDGYQIVNGEAQYLDNNPYDSIGTNVVFFIGDETTIESSREVNRGGLFEALKYSDEFVEHFSTPENYTNDYNQFDESRRYHFTDTKVLDKSGSILTIRQEYLIDDETIYGVIRYPDGTVESTYGTYSSNYNKGY